jgi:hypothetical protein
MIICTVVVAMIQCDQVEAPVPSPAPMEEEE